MVASVIAESVIIRVRPSWVGVRIFGASISILKAPIANPIEMPMVERMLCFWIMPIEVAIKLKVLDIQMKQPVKFALSVKKFFFEKEMCLSVNFGQF